MAQQPIGNEDKMAEVRKLMEEKKLEALADKVSGGDAEDIINVDFTSDFGKRYTGKIQFKRPNVLEVMKIGGRKSEILRQSGVQELTLVDPSVRMMAEAIATLETVVVKCPEWFLDIQKVNDLDLVFHIFTRYEVWSNSFRVGGTDEPQADSTSTESA